MPNPTDPSLPPSEFTLDMICFLYLSACVFFSAPAHSEALRTAGRVRRHWGLSHTWVYLGV